MIESLPRFTMASALAALPKSSPDCAVCLSPFTPDAELRLLPACRHAFHAGCVDAWLRTSPTCPLCRATVALPHPSISAILAVEQPPPPEPPRSRDRFRVEMGSVSSRGSPINSSGGGDSRTYSLGSFDYHIEEEVEAVVSRMVRAVARASENIKEEKPAAEGSPSPPGETVAEAAGSPARGWLREYMDRLASSAWSLAFPGRWSSRCNQRNEEPWLWDTEAAAMPPPPPLPGSDEEETAFMVLYRWIAAV
jgi:E3 ubiquitin-protein ligase ATL4